MSMSTIDLENKKFALIENDEGHALKSTQMIFDSSKDPYRGTYIGPNTQFGQVLVSGERMLYQSVDLDGKLSAGEAGIELIASGGVSTMVLTWRWLTGDHSSGISKWRQIDT